MRRVTASDRTQTIATSSKQTLKRQVSEKAVINPLRRRYRYLIRSAAYRVKRGQIRWIKLAFHLAQSNIARMRAAMEDPVMAGFVARLESLNALADASPGFVWRYQTEAGDATEVRVFEDELILFNMSVWESIEHLEAYVYRSHHVEALQQRASWFERPARSPLVLWWLPAGHIPSVEEAKQRFDALWRDGPSAYAFTFRERFAAVEASVVAC